MDPLVASVSAAEAAYIHLGDRDRNVAAIATAAAELRAAWTASTATSTLLLVGELASPPRAMVQAALTCARLAQRAQPSPDPDVELALRVLGAWLEGSATDEARAACIATLQGRYNGRYAHEVLPVAWATYCACCVGTSRDASCWYHANPAADLAIRVLREAGDPAPEVRVADILRRVLTCPSPEQLAQAIAACEFCL